MASLLEPVEQGLDIFNNKFSWFFNQISCWLLFIMPIPVFLDVLARYIFASSIPGVIEIEGYLLLIIVFLALAYTQYSEGHIRIDLLITKFPDRVRSIIDTCNYFVCTQFFLLMSVQIFKGGLTKIADQEISYDLEIPTFIFWFIASFGTLLLAIAVSQDFFRSLNRALKTSNKLMLAGALMVCCIVLTLPMLGVFPSNINPTVIGILGMFLLFALLFLGMPIAFGMANTGYLGMILVYQGVDPALAMLGLSSIDTGSSYMLTVVPLFILMGELAYRSGISQDLFDTANKWLGRAPGGLAMSSVAGCAGFSAVCGDSLATAVTMGTIAVPEMKKKKYNMRLATGCVAAGGTLGILIPPSVGFIFYAIVTEESIGELFIAGLIPGVLLAGLFMGAIYLAALRNPEVAPRGEATTFREKISSLRGIIGMLLLSSYLGTGPACAGRYAENHDQTAVDSDRRRYSRLLSCSDPAPFFTCRIRDRTGSKPLCHFRRGYSAVYAAGLSAQRDSDDSAGPANYFSIHRSARFRSGLVRRCHRPDHGDGPDHPADRRECLCHCQCYEGSAHAGDFQGNRSVLFLYGSVRHVVDRLPSTGDVFTESDVWLVWTLPVRGCNLTLFQAYFQNRDADLNLSSFTI